VKSKKPSAAKPPEGTVFFLDRSLGVDQIRRELEAIGLNVEIHDDHFPRDSEDQFWLREVGRRGWVVLTKDQRIRYRPMELEALRSSGARVFVLIAGNLRGAEIAAVFTNAMPGICRVLDDQPGPFVRRITSRGEVGAETLSTVRTKGERHRGGSDRT
jgi:hypothetical protein